MRPAIMPSYFGQRRANEPDPGRLAELQRVTEQEGRRISPQEWTSIGGDINNYHQLYGGVDNEAFTALQRETEATGRRITPEEYISLGGDPRQYHQMYGDEAPAQGQPAPGVSSFNPLQTPYVNPNNFSFNSPQGALGADIAASNYQANQQQQYNRVDEIGPYGSAQYVRDPETGQITRQYDLSPNQSAINALQEGKEIGLGNAVNSAIQGLDGKVGQEYNPGGLPNAGDPSLSNVPQVQAQGYGNAPQVNNLDYNGLPSLAGAGDLAGERQRIEKSVYDNFTRRMQPQFDREKQEFQQQMADQGITQGSEQYTRQERNLAQRQNDAMQNASAQATQLGGGEMSRLFGIGLQGRQQGASEKKDVYSSQAADRARSTNETDRQFGQQVQVANQGLGKAQAGFGMANTARNQALSEYDRGRSTPLNELGQLSQLQGGVTNPNFSPISQISFNPLNPSGVGMGYNQMAQDASLAHLGAQTQIGVANIGAQSRIDAAQLAGQNALAQIGAQYQGQQSLQDGRHQFAEDNQVDGPSFGEIALPGVIGGIGGGIGQGFGSWLGGFF